MATTVQFTVNGKPQRVETDALFHAAQVRIRSMPVGDESFRAA